MNRLRAVLAESYVGDVAIAVLLFLSLTEAVTSLRHPFMHVTDYLTAKAVHGVPPFLSSNVTKADLLIICWHLIYAVVFFALAGAMSVWLYDLMPFAALKLCHAELKRKHA